MRTATLPAADLHGQPVALADFDGDGHPDLLWRHRVSGATVIWFLNGVTITNAVASTGAGLRWEVGATGDLNGDGRADIVWRNTVTGDDVVWFMNGATLVGTGTL